MQATLSLLIPRIYEKMFVLHEEINPETSRRFDDVHDLRDQVRVGFGTAEFFPESYHREHVPATLGLELGTRMKDEPEQNWP